ncbi:HlyD family efflux transporter periplasmic adaptor subunit [Desulfobacterales bacterium HSG17]|nr:HlyD family efflux transporter periplasmic adaptor subunit [Desulfobacterales bacterium HSG17]
MKVVTILVMLITVFPCFSFGENELTVQSAKKEITLTGYTRSNASATVSSEVSGKVIKVNYDVGDIVGEKPFFKIDPTFIDFQMESTRQSLAKINAAHKKNESRIAYLKKEFKRIDLLHKGDRATGVKRDAAQEEFDQARLERNTLKAEKQVLKITLKELQERKNRHNVYAPKGWIIIGKMVEPGEIISSNTPLAKVGDFQNLVIPLSVSGKELDAIRALPEELDARLEGKQVKTRLNWVNPEFDEKTRKLSIELLLIYYKGEKRGGLSFSMLLEIDAQGYWVPKSAVVNRYENPRVIVKSTEETVNIIILGESDDHFIIAENKNLPAGTELTGNK